MKKLRIAVLALSIVALGGLTACDDDTKAVNPAKPEAKKTPSVGGKPGPSAKKVDPALLESMDMLAILNDMADQAEMAASGCNEDGQQPEGQLNTFKGHLKKITTISQERNESWEVGLAGIPYTIKQAPSKYCQLGYVAEVAAKTIESYATQVETPLSNDEERARRKAIAQGLLPLYTDLMKWVKVLGVEDTFNEKKNREEIEVTKDSIIEGTGKVIEVANQLSQVMDCSMVMVQVPDVPVEVQQEQEACAAEKAQIKASKEAVDSAHNTLISLKDNGQAVETGARVSIVLDILKKEEAIVEANLQILSKMLKQAQSAKRRAEVKAEKEKQSADISGVSPNPSTQQDKKNNGSYFQEIQ